MLQIIVSLGARKKDPRMPEPVVDFLNRKATKKGLSFDIKSLEACRRRVGVKNIKNLKKNTPKSYARIVSSVEIFEVFRGRNFKKYFLVCSMSFNP